MRGLVELVEMRGLGYFENTMSYRQLHVIALHYIITTYYLQGLLLALDFDVLAKAILVSPMLCLCFLVDMVIITRYMLSCGL